MQCAGLLMISIRLGKNQSKSHIIGFNLGLPMNNILILQDPCENIQTTRIIHNSVADALIITNSWERSTIDNTKIIELISLYNHDVHLYREEKQFRIKWSARGIHILDRIFKNSNPNTILCQISNFIEAIDTICSDDRKKEYLRV